MRLSWYLEQIMSSDIQRMKNFYIPFHSHLCFSPFIKMTWTATKVYNIQYIYVCVHVHVCATAAALTQQNKLTYCRFNLQLCNSFLLQFHLYSSLLIYRAVYVCVCIWRICIFRLPLSILQNAQTKIFCKPTDITYTYT